MSADTRHGVRSDTKLTKITKITKRFVVSVVLVVLVAFVPERAAVGRLSATQGRLPVDQLAPGTYDLRVVVQQGSTRLTRSTLLRIVE